MSLKFGYPGDMPDESVRCPLCANVGDPTPSPCMKFQKGSADYRFECERCGTFELLDYCWDDLPGKAFNREDGLRLSGLARLEGNAKRRLAIHDDNKQELVQKAPVPADATAYYDRLFMAIATRCKRPGDASAFDLRPVAAECFLSMREANNLIIEMRPELFHTAEEVDPKQWKFRLKREGYELLHKLSATGPASRYAFIAMWFDAEMNPAAAAITNALRAAGYEPPFRVDDPKHEAAPEGERHDKIDDRIIAAIRRSRFIVVDVTGNRSAVYFEAGYAMGLGIPVLWCCREGSEKTDMCFDTRQYGHILWKDETDLARRLAERIDARGWNRTRA